MNRIVVCVLVSYMGCLTQASGQSGIINTVAGGAPFIFPANITAALNAPLGEVTGVAVDSQGNIYVADINNNRIYLVSPNGSIRTVAGNGAHGFSGDGGPATSAALNNPSGVAVDSTGNLFIADSRNNRIRKVSPSGIITTVAGDGTTAFSGDGGPATSASLSPSGVAVDSSGNLFIADSRNNRIRKVSPSGIITTVAGDGTTAFSGDGGPATSASLYLNVGGVAVDGSGNLFIADCVHNRIRKVSSDGIITTVAGGGASGLGDGGPATSVALSFPSGVAADAAGNFFIADTINNRIRKVSPSGTITTVAGNGTQGFSGDGGSATSAALQIHEVAVNPTGIAVDGSGNLFIGDTDNERIRKVATNGIITTVAGNGAYGFSGDGGPATSASLQVSAFSNGGGAVAVDGSGNIFIADTFNQRIRKVSPSGIITTVAGNGAYGFSGDGGPATSASLSRSSDVAVDGSGNLFIADFQNGRIRKVSPSGIITTIAGGGNSGLGDGGPATSASLSPGGIAVDTSGNLFIADSRNYRIRKVSLSGTITTVAGNGTSAFDGDGGPAISSSLSNPGSVGVDGSGNLFIVDNQRIRKVSTSGIIATVAGNGSNGFSGDGGPATSASLNFPSSVAVDGSGNLFIADFQNGRIRKVSPSGIITTAAGGGNSGLGDGGPATLASSSLVVSLWMLLEISSLRTRATIGFERCQPHLPRTVLSA